MKWIDRLRVRHTLRHHPIPLENWRKLMGEAEIFRGLTSVERARLRKLTTLFLHRKAFSGTHGLELTTDMLLAVAAQACLLILKLGLDHYHGWREIILYPGAFKVSRDVNENGVVSDGGGHLTGESWQRGPVVLSWATAAADLASLRFTPWRIGTVATLSMTVRGSGRETKIGSSDRVLPVPTPLPMLSKRPASAPKNAVPWKKHREMELRATFSSRSSAESSMTSAPSGRLTGQFTSAPLTVAPM